MSRLTNKMGLISWSSLPDPYDFAQLDENWQKVDFHDHTPGRGVQIPMGGLAPGSVGPVQLAPSVGVVPVGGIVMWSTPTIPAGWLLCDGSNYLQTLYASLYAVIGTIYNNSASTTPSGYFGVPWINLGPPLTYGNISWIIKT